MRTHADLIPAEDRLELARGQLRDAAFAAPPANFNLACQTFQEAAWAYIAACRRTRADPERETPADLEAYDPPCPADLPNPAGA